MGLLKKLPSKKIEKKNYFNTIFINMATHVKKHQQTKGLKELIIKGKGQEYAEVTEPLGDCRFKCVLLNREEIKAIITGRLIKGPHKQTIKKGDFVLVEIDSSTTETKKYFIIHKYTPDDKKQLAKMGELKTVVTNTNAIIIENEEEASNQAQEIDDDFIDNL
jgi:translation initiation factor IF-1